MLRTRPAGVTMIVLAALVSTSTAYLLVVRALDHAGPAAAEPAAILPDSSAQEHEAAVQATLLCLAAAGLVPLAEPTRAKSVTRITVDRKSVDEETAEAIIAGCGAEAEAGAAEAEPGVQMLRADQSESPGSSEKTCLPAGLEHGGSKAFCFDNILAATGLEPLAGH